MKFLEYTPLSSLNSFLHHINVGDYVVEGDIQAYSCKLAGVDKKLSRSLDQEVVSTLSTTPPSLLSSSPVGPLSESQSRKTLIYLILTLNHMYPDYDFSMLRAHHFRKDENVNMAKANIEQLLLETGKVWNQEEPGQNFLDVLWQSVDEVMDLKDCDVYSYNADMEGDPFAEVGQVWAFNHFFYNKKLKRILYFSCRSKLARQENDSDSDVGEQDEVPDETFADDMDLN
ncbi:hypothetical protein CYMTET_8896 [Cymbomonas tetramitiformis]|uniref:Repressor of RNA polymerase III transcription n=1 Tax=Cymbomonas tetramitiformis TaxID=36881 RepID=A0AAE0GS55_9CHLO|nr:hypothetical protein CYMTET_8896 [Cymbomonas tetramitiformis]